MEMVLRWATPPASKCAHAKFRVQLPRDFFGFLYANFRFLALCFCAGKFCAVVDVYSWLKLSWLDLGLAYSCPWKEKHKKNTGGERRTKQNNRGWSRNFPALSKCLYKSGQEVCSGHFTPAFHSHYPDPGPDRPSHSTEVQVFALFLYPGSRYGSDSGIGELPIMTVTLVSDWWMTSCEWEFHDH